MRVFPSITGFRLASVLFGLSILSGTWAPAVERKIRCIGQAEEGMFIIRELMITQKEIFLNYGYVGSQDIIKKYATTQFMHKNGSTDIHKDAYLIAGSKRGEKSDDIVIPQYGEYSIGLVSEVAFNHGDKRLFGTISCKEE